MDQLPREVLDHILTSIGPASAAQAAGARQRLAERGDSANLGRLEALVERVAAARHSPHPLVTNKMVVICAADHGVADSGVDLGENNPTIIAIRHIAAGKAAVNAAARSADTRVVLVDCGIRGAEHLDLGPGVLALRVGDASADITQGPAMSAVEAILSVQTGIALLFSLADEGLDTLALGHVSCGSQPVSAAVVAAITGLDASAFDAADRDAIASALAANQPARDQPLEILARVGGFELGVMCGLILAAASINLPIVLDGHGTSAAALLAARLCPAVAGYMIASHGGDTAAHRLAMTELELEAIFDLGIAQGEGTGAVLALPLIDAAAALLAESE